MTDELGTFYRTDQNEDFMNEEHFPLWSEMIRRMKEHDLLSKTVIDFGCNQGGLLRLLFRAKPFKKGIGIDKAKESIHIASEKSKEYPLEYQVSGTLSSLKESADILLSHEVLYLLPNLSEHAKEVYHALKPGGVYYAALGAHTDNPLWTHFKQQLEKDVNMPFYDYSVCDIVRAFHEAGFDVFAQKFLLKDFVKLQPHDAYFPRAMDALQYFSDVKILFRFVRRTT